jgi:hypothetical protein
MKTKLLYFLVFLSYISSMYPWMFWDTHQIYLNFIVAAYSAYYLINKNNAYIFSKKGIYVVVLLLASFLWMGSRGTAFGILNQLFIFCTIATITLFREEDKIALVHFIIQGMSILLGLSIIFFLMHQMGLNLPHSSISGTQTGYVGENYYLFVTYGDGRSFVRFRSIFAEPGHVVMGVIPLLYLTKLNFRKRSVVIFTVTILLSVSLAGYLLLFVTALLVLVRTRSVNNKLIIISGAALFLGVMFTSNPGQVAIQSIQSRIAVTGDSYLIKGYNRTDLHVDNYFRTFISGGQLVTGVSHADWANLAYGSAGYKVFVIRNGLIGLVLVLILYLTFLFRYFNYEVFGYFCIILLLLSQNGYPLWFCIISSYSLGVVYISKQMKVYP